MNDEPILQVFGPHPDAVLGGWFMDSANVPKDACLVLIPNTIRMQGGDGIGMRVPMEQDARTVPHGHGDRVHITIEFDVLLDEGSATFVNRLCQEAFDGVRAGALEITGKQLVLINDPVKA